jgi:glycosyltransferase involved in cell wall biosynthesis
MKILIVAPLPPYHRGGIERVVGELAPRLSRNHDVEVHVWSGTLGRAQACDWKGVHVRTYQTSKRAAYASLRMFADLKRFAREVDVVHAHGSSTLIPFIAALTAGHTPLVISPHFHQQASNKLFGILKLPFECTVDRYTLGKASKVICVSETEAAMIRKRFSVENKIVVIYNGVNADEIQSAEPYDFDGTLILYVGRLERYKNVQRVVEAVNYLPQDFMFYIIGEGPYKSELEAVIQRNKLGGRVQLLGSCPDAHLYRWIKTSALLVNLSEVEAFGITVLEALAAGKPVLVNDEFGLHELAERFQGAVVRIKVGKTNAPQLAKALEDTVRVRSAVDLGEYRWDHIASRTLAAYKDVENL